MLPIVGHPAGAMAIAIMAHINLRITLVVFVPLLALLGASRVAWGRIHPQRAGSLERLVASCREMYRIWAGDFGV